MIATMYKDIVPENNNNGNKDLYFFTMFVSSLSLIGVGFSVANALFIWLIKQPQPSFQLFLYIIQPLVALSVVYISLASYFKFRHAIAIAYIAKRWRKAFAILLAILTFQCFYLFQISKNTELPSVSLSELLAMDSFNGSNEKYYVIFGSQNCTYCHQMEPTFSEVYFQNQQLNMYYVDLTYEKLNSPNVTKLNISSIPSLIFYQNGIEIDRLEGLASYKDVISFIEQGKKGVMIMN